MNKKLSVVALFVLGCAANCLADEHEVALLGSGLKIVSDAGSVIKEQTQEEMAEAVKKAEQLVASLDVSSKDGELIYDQLKPLAAAINKIQDKFKRILILEALTKKVKQEIEQADVIGFFDVFIETEKTKFDEPFITLVDVSDANRSDFLETVQRYVDERKESLENKLIEEVKNDIKNTITGKVISAQEVIKINALAKKAKGNKDALAEIENALIQKYFTIIQDENVLDAEKAKRILNFTKVLERLSQPLSSEALKQRINEQGPKLQKTDAWKEEFEGSYKLQV